MNILSLSLSPSPSFSSLLFISSLRPSYFLSLFSYQGKIPSGKQCAGRKKSGERG
jgi:hypothetical protein